MADRGTGWKKDGKEQAENHSIRRCERLEWVSPLTQYEDNISGGGQTSLPGDDHTGIDLDCLTGRDTQNVIDQIEGLRHLPAAGDASGAPPPCYPAASQCVLTIHYPLIEHKLEGTASQKHKHQGGKLQTDP